MKINNMLIPLLGLTFTSVVLIGCGGGGSKPTEAISSNSFIGGTAAKGIIQQGIVNAYIFNQVVIHPVKILLKPLLE